MSKSIFRKKSLENISSPDEMNDYIKVTKPSMWLVLIGIILVLVAIVVWAITGEIEATIIENGIKTTKIVSPIYFLLN